MKKIISILIVLCLVLSMFTGCGANIATNSYDIEITFDEKEKIIQGSMTVTYLNSSSDTLNELQFNLSANAYRENATLKAVPDSRFYDAYPNGKSYGYIDIANVKDVGGQTLEHKIAGKDKTLLVVTLKEQLKPNSTVKVCIDFSIKLANVLHRLGYNENTVYIGNAFPLLAVYENGAFVECPYYNVGDPFYSTVANYTVTFKHPSSYVVGASGKVVKSIDGGDFTKTTYKIDNARDFALTMSKDYNVLTGAVDGIDIIYLYQKDTNSNDSFITITEAVRTFNKLFGKYPYETLTVSETPFIEGGMEFPGLVYVSATLNDTDKTEVIVHEIAHEWWYGVVGNNQLEFSVFDEGLAQYSTLMFFENNSKYDINRENRIEKLKENYKNYIKIENIAHLTSNSTICKPLNKFSSSFEYVFKTYVLGEIFFDDLRTVMGDVKFTKALQSVYGKYKFDEITLDEFALCMSESSKIDLSSYIKSYLAVN